MTGFIKGIGNRKISKRSKGVCKDGFFHGYASVEGKVVMVRKLPGKGKRTWQLA